MDFGNHLEQFSLKWNNFNDNMKSGFHDLLRTEDFVDVTIAAEGKLIQAHKMVLSVCSPYFKNIFKANPCQHPVIFLKDVTHKELSGILQFMYLGEVSVQQEDLGRFLKTAEALQIKGLTGDDNDAKDEEIEESFQENDEHSVTNTSKLVNNDVEEKEICAKRMKLNSSNDLIQNNGQPSVQNQLETVLNNVQNSNVSPKTELVEGEFSDIESDKISIKDDSASVSDSILQLQDSISDIRDEGNHSPIAPNSSGQTQDILSGAQGRYNECTPSIMGDGNQGLRYFPLLTKNQGLCPICGRILQHKKNLQTHIADQHSGILRSWTCQICHKACKTWSALRVHTNRHHTKLGALPMVDVTHSLN